MAEENVVSIAFADSSKAYQAFTEIKNLSTAGALQLKSGAIVVRDTEGKLSFPDGVDQVTGTGFAGGGLIGMLVGILGGPLGMLLGWGSGALIGGALDAGRASATNEVLGEFSRALPVDSTAVIAEVVEPSELPLDDVVSKLGWHDCAAAGVRGCCRIGGRRGCRGGSPGRGSARRAGTEEGRV